MVLHIRPDRYFFIIVVLIQALLCISNTQAAEEPFVLEGRAETVHIWGRGNAVKPRHFGEFLPALFERTLRFTECTIIDSTVLHWIFTGESGGFTIHVSADSVALQQRFYDSNGLFDPAAMQPWGRHPERQWMVTAAVLDGPLRTLQVISDGNMQIIVNVNGVETLRQVCKFDVNRHQLQLSGGPGPVAGMMEMPDPVDTRIRLDPDVQYQTMIGFGGITTPLSYRELSPAGQRRWWTLLAEYNLLVHREYPIGTMLKPDLSNWDHLEDGIPHYYGSNFPNSEMSDFEYLANIRKLGGDVWFEFWGLPRWAMQPESHGGITVNIDKYCGAIIDYCRKSRQLTGQPPDVVGIQNEVTQTAATWHAMAAGLRKALDANGFRQVKIHMADAGTLKSGLDFARDFQKERPVWDVIDYAATHLYDYQTMFTDPDQFDVLLRQWKDLTGDKPFLSTELCLNSRNWQISSYRVAFMMGQLYHKNLTLVNASAVCYCWLLLSVAEPSYGWTRTLFVPDQAHGFMPKPSSYQLRVFGAFSRRVKKNMVRIDAASEAPGLLVSAFRDNDGAGTVILLNRSTVPYHVRLDGRVPDFRWMELAGPYSENQVTGLNGRDHKEWTVQPGEIVTLSSEPLSQLPDGFLSRTVEE